MKKEIRSLPVQIREVNKEKRRITFVASDETTDRYGTSIEVAGWDLKNFKKNPRFLFGHNYSSPSSVIGRVMKATKDLTNKQLMIDVQFVPREINPVAEMVFQMYTSEPRFLDAVSVGFIPYDYEDKEMDWEKYKEIKKTGKIPLTRVYKKQELLEVSAVIIPANPTALIDEAKSAGVDATSLMAARTCMPGIGDEEEIRLLNERMEEWICKEGVCAPACENELSDPEPDTDDDDEDDEERVGATLSAKNRSLLELAQTNIGTVLAAAVKDEGDEKELTEEQVVALAQSVLGIVVKRIVEEALTKGLELLAKDLKDKFSERAAEVDEALNEVKALITEKQIDEEPEPDSVSHVLDKWAAVGASQAASKQNGE